MRRAAIQISLLTIFFVGAYFSLRAIPGANCNFLHYEQTVVTADGLQFCGSGAAYFVDLDKLPFPVKVNLTPDRATAPGVETHYTLSLETTDGKILRPSELAVSQTQKLHLLVVDSGLEDYQHIHPVPDGDSGQWTFAFTPQRSGTYQVYAQFIPSLSLREMIGETAITVPGEPEPGVKRGLAPFKDGDYIYNLSVPANPVPAGADTTLTLSVQRADGGPVQLEDVMGTLAHMVAFDPARHGAAHLHPTLTNHERDPLKPELAFVINLAQPGDYHLWAQVKIAGHDRYVPFDVNVVKPG